MDDEILNDTFRVDRRQTIGNANVTVNDVKSSVTTYVYIHMQILEIFDVAQYMRRLAKLIVTIFS